MNGPLRVAVARARIRPVDDPVAIPRPRLRLNSRTTLALIGGLLIAAGFVSGLLVQRNFGAGPSTTVPNGFGLGPAGGGTGAGAGAGGSATTGTVKLVDGTTVYLTTAAGDTVTVKTSGSTAVRLAQSTAAQDLPVGATVTVQGTTGSDGSITATTVTTQK